MKNIIKKSFICAFAALATLVVSAFDTPYLTFRSADTFSLQVGTGTTGGWNGTMEYSTDAATWTTWDGTTITAGDSGSDYRLYLRGTGNKTVTDGSQWKYWTFPTGSDIYCEGDIETLRQYDGTAPAMNANCYYGLFKSCTKLKSAPVLSATTLANYCYHSMFKGCTSLTAAPALPATVLQTQCYREMFSGCTTLESAGPIAATSTAQECCREMFYDCKALTNAPSLPATTLAQLCYYGMFNGCKAITTAPEIDATIVASQCCQNMFKGCTALTNAPVLHAETLVTFCYQSMFEGCTALVKVPDLTATTLAQTCYKDMFKGCTSLAVAPAIMATTLAIQCCDNMFYNCTKLTTVPDFPAVPLASNCYYAMFQNCTSLVEPPALPATELANNCYQLMFLNCTSLISLPKLNATTVPNYAYNAMFQGCSKLEISTTLTPGKKTWKLPAGLVGGSNWNASMFYQTKNWANGTTGPQAGITYYILSKDSTELSQSANEFNAWTGDTISVNLASTIVGGSMTYVFSGLTGAPAGVTLDGVTLSATIATAGTYDFTVHVEDTSSTPLTLDAEYRVIVTDPDPITAPGANLGKARVGKEKSYALADTVAGGVAPYTFTLKSGSIPDGYTLVDGVLSGTATEDKTNTFILTITDKLNVSQDIEYTLVTYTPVGIKDDDPDEPETGDTIQYFNGDDTFQRTCIRINNASTVVTWEDSWYYVTGSVTLSKGAIVNGKVSLILCDGATLTINGESGTGRAGIHVVVDGVTTNTITIYGQAEGTGKLRSTGAMYAAGIGGDNKGDVNTGTGLCNCGKVNIYGGVIEAHNNGESAAIGGGRYGSGGTITIYGGDISAICNSYASGIGGASPSGNGAGGNVTVYGGRVSANSGTSAYAGIGSYSNRSQGTLTVGPNVKVKADNSNPPTTVLPRGAGGVIDLGTGANRMCFLLEESAPDPLDRTGSGTLQVYENQVFNWNIAETIIGGTDPYTLSASSLPDGLSMSDGVISGSVATVGEYPITVEVTDRTSPAMETNFVYTLTVIFAPKAITYKDGEEDLTGLEPAAYTPGTAVDLATPASKTGYTFDGWYDNDGLAGDAVTAVSVSATDDLTFYAKYTPIVYSITYMDADATLTGLAPATYTIVSGATLPATATKDGNDFCGWYADLGLTEGPVTTIPAGTIDNKTFWAKWEAILPIERTGDAALQVKAYKSINWNVASGVTGGKAPLTFAASGLPTGVAMSEAGVVSGSLAAAGTYPFTVTVTDAKSRQETFDYSITVVAVSPVEEGEPAEPDTGVVIQYKAADGQMRTRMATPVTSSNAAVTWEDSWYYVTGDVTLSAGAMVNGSVCLILGDGATLTTTGANDCAGVNVANGNTLTIYGQAEGDGALTATGGGNAAGIGGNTSEGWGTIHVYACNITANGSGAGRGIGKGNWGSDAGSLYIHSTDLHVTAGAYEDPTATRSCDADGKVSFNNNDKYVLIVYDPTAPLAAGETDLGSVTKGEYVTKNLKNSISGGRPQYTFAVKEGSSLPTGLSLLESGLLWGTTTFADSYSFWVTVTDAASQTIDVKFTFKVNGIFGISYYEADGETPISAQPVTYIEGTGVAYEDMPVPEMTGYDFAGWYTDTDLTEGPVTSISTSEAIDKVFYAKWKATVYPITYYWGTQECSEGDTHDDLEPTAYTIEDEDITLPIPEKEGWYFEGWYNNPQLAGSPVTTISEGSTGEKAFYSKWEQAGQPFTQKENELSADAGFEMSISLTPTVSGGKKPYSFALKSGSELPGDVTLSKAGVLSGTVAAAGAYEFTVVVTDDIETEPIEATYTLYVDLTKNTTDPLGCDGVFYVGFPVNKYLASAIRGGTAPYTFEVADDIEDNMLPSGIVLNGSVLEGTITMKGNAYFWLKVTDSKGVSSYLRYWIYSQSNTAQENSTVNGVNWSWVEAQPPKEDSRITIWNSEDLMSDGKNAIPLDTAGCVYVPDGSSLWTGREPVTCIGRNAFKNCDKITRVTLPVTITDIGEYAFDGCTALKAVVIPSSGILEHINTNAFAGATSLEHIYVGKGDKVAFTALLEASGYAVTDENFVVECDFYTLTLDTNLGDELEMPVLTKAYTETIYLPNVGNLPVPSRNNYTFDGWYTEKFGGIRINEDDTLSGGDWTLYAHWSTTLPDPVFTINGKGELTDVTLNGHTEITIPDTVTSIGNRALDGLRVSANKNLLRVVIPDTVKDIGLRAFAECDRLREINIPNGVTNISTSAFSLCGDLESVVIPGSVEAIGDHAFANCSNLVSVTIGNGVKSIGPSAFWYCTSLSCDNAAVGFYIPDSVTSIGSGAFHSVAFEKASLPGALYSEGDPVGAQFTSAVIMNTILVTYRDLGEPVFKMIGTSLRSVQLNGCTSVTIPHGVTEIFIDALSGLSEMTSVTIPNTVTNIWSDAFADCTGLTEIEIPNSVVRIRYPFRGCTGLKRLTVPDSVTDLNLWSCSNLVEVVVGRGVTEIGETAFAHCSALERVTFNGDLTRINQHAFWYCSSLQEINFPDTLRYIGLFAFMYCTSLESVTIPKFVTVERHAFSGCTSLKQAKVGVEATTKKKVLLAAPRRRLLATAPETTTIGERAFSSCTKLEEVTLGSTVSDIGAGAFSGCAKLRNITMEPGNENYSSNNGLLLKGTTELVSAFGAASSVSVPSGVTTIAPGAFADCEAIASVTLPSGLTTIGEAAFSNATHLATATISSGVESIGANAFHSTALKTVCVGSTSHIDTLRAKISGSGYDTAGVTFVAPTESITIDDGWKEANGLSEATDEQVTAAMLSQDDNGLSKWQNYVLNQDADEPVKVAGVQSAGDGTTINVAPAFSNEPRANTGYTVKYSIDTITADGEVISAVTNENSAAFSVDLSGITSNAFFKVKATLKSETTDEEVPVETENTIGVLAIKDAPKTTVIGVPFKSLSEDGSISVSNLVHTANLSDGAQLKAFDTNGKLNSWTLEGGVWTADTIVEPGSASPSAGADTIKLDRGKGVWLTRADEDLGKPIYLIGEASNEAVETELEAPTEENGTAWTLVASPSVEPVDVADIAGANTGDRIIVPADGIPRNYSYKDGEWGYDGNDEPEEIAPGITVVRPKRITGDNKIPAGRGFWYLNKDAGSKSINW